ncbi:ATP-binding cassette domain-containing protein [Klebsiella quasivariicola]|uniref:ATP-binding cassette domain-containing protein n=1 Tax=Klebsiella quasivariicola TaxID=2026240 RepID=UPI001E4F21FE|nr:ATP-binding cassette domain-containing protein [Klebsiella quasivariicola]UDC39435.1 ATP-binding cassette domain-containing protein [Klebsiella quasivariicola]
MLTLTTSAPTTARFRRCTTSACISNRRDRHAYRRQRAGKTTLLGTLCAIRGPPAGALSLTVRILPTGRRRKSCVKRWRSCRKGGASFSRMTVEENLAMGGFFADRDQFHTRIKWVYELFPRLHERRIQRAGTMSGGEQQMLAIGRALMSQPRLLLLDEPSLGLAPIIIQQIFDTIEQLREQGMTIFLVEQNANQALKLPTAATCWRTATWCWRIPATRCWPTRRCAALSRWLIHRNPASFISPVVARARRLRRPGSRSHEYI